MKKTHHNIEFFLMALILSIAALNLYAASDTDKEDQLKAAFLYNFLKFVDWPADKLPDNNEPVVIGIYSGQKFAKMFEPIKDKTAGSRQIIIKEFACAAKGISNEDWNKQIEAFRQCHILFFVDYPDAEITKKIIEALNGRGVLIVGQKENFLEAGGNINFIIEENKLRFEINLVSTKNNNLKIRSNLLKLAKRVIEDKSSQETKG
ncbi:MAG: YfiR family protein [Phycisphaerae bacterium]